MESETKKGSIVAVGMFDGVHRGHRFVLDYLCRLAENSNLVPAIVTFDNHPSTVLRPDCPVRLLSDTRERIRLIQQAGIERILVLPFTEELRNLTALRFAERILMPELDARAVLVGYDNGFGSDTLRGSRAYTQALAPLGIKVYECPMLPGKRVSSSMVREALSQGNVALASRMLGHPYTISGKVIQGRQLGRKLGFPTANIATAPSAMLPANGVYVGRTVGAIDGHMNLPVIINIGPNPTVTGSQNSPVSVEAHIIGPEGFCPDLYGHTLTVELIARLRGEHTFASLEDLTTAIEADRRAALEILSTN